MNTKIKNKVRKTSSDFADTFAQIAWQHVNKESYPNVNEEDLTSLEEIFYFHLENRILMSILQHADEDILRMYESRKNVEKDESSEANEETFNYEAFDFLVSMMIGDDELQPKVEADIAEFAREFGRTANGYWE